MRSAAAEAPPSLPPGGRGPAPHTLKRGLMSTERITKPVSPLRCTRCGDEDGPFVPKAGLCEDCETETASALRGLGDAA